MTLKIGILLFAFHAALGLENRMAEALLFLKEINEIFSRIEFPESEKSRLYKRIVNDPWAYDQATIMEKFQSLYDQLKTGTGTEYWLNWTWTTSFWTETELWRNFNFYERNVNCLL